MDEDNSNKKDPSRLKETVEKKPKVKIFDHQFGSIERIESDDNVPVYATYEICFYYWET